MYFESLISVCIRALNMLSTVKDVFSLEYKTIAYLNYFIIISDHLNYIYDSRLKTRLILLKNYKLN